jgi:hypothetical protein
MKLTCSDRYPSSARLDKARKSKPITANSGKGSRSIQANKTHCRGPTVVSLTYCKCSPLHDGLLKNYVRPSATHTIYTKD